MTMSPASPDAALNSMKGEIQGDLLSQNIGLTRGLNIVLDSSVNPSEGFLVPLAYTSKLPTTQAWFYSSKTNDDS
jgi:hypothetical protein